MAYCSRCGVQIADGSNFCPSCGAAQAGGVAMQTVREETAYTNETSTSPDYEEERRKKQEYYRRWADNERDRRASENAADPFNRIQGKLEYLGQKLSEAASRVMKDEDKKEKLFAALSYLGPLCFLPRFLCANSDFARYHGRQGAKLFAAVIIATIIGKIIDAEFAVTLAQIAFMAIGFRNSINGKKEALPLIGDIKIFENL